ncbi:ABC transporter ATP-binding protein [Luteimonas sp. FCS-9]|uniref:ABC transporter ATP-binding protein n=1 Tax=Luteimonas sp. FCS-9 TaxID=1547516 RepID=UPI00063E9BCA|nr:ABC transporter ATP-binding protein [Luteimonas sp. FCS-9]KLI98008.1 macrolide ABC transporter ATP-binding protein [Luteimonas sp. FCS-9]
MISLRGIEKRYEMGGEIVKALDSVDLDIGQNEYVALTGASGSGKTTLMNIIGCLDTPTAGNYQLNGRDVSSLDESSLASVRNQDIGFVFQSFHLLPRLTVVQNVMQPLVYRGIRVAQRKEMAIEALVRVGLGNRLNHLPNQLSGGQRQRVAIARAMVGSPAILLADEPTGNLDLRTTAEIMELFHSLHASGNTLVVVTHEPDIAAHCHRTLRVSEGKIAEDISRPGGSK